MRKVIVSVVCAMITAVCGGALADDWDDEDVNWLEYNDDDGSPDFEELFGAGLDLSSSEEDPGGGYTDGAYYGDCEYFDTTLDRIECTIENDHLESIAIGLASYTINGDKAIIMCYDDGSTITRAGWANLDVAHKLFVYGSSESDNIFIVREATYYTAQCDFEDFPNVFDDDYYTYGELYILGDDGNDIVAGSQWADSNLIGETVYGKQGDDVISAEGTSSAYIEGNYGEDTIVGTIGTDEIYGGNDGDNINAGSGDDYVEGGPGNDTIYGANGNDELRGETGNDYVYSGAGRDTLYGGSGNDYLFGDDDTDYEFAIYGGDGNDWLYDTGNALLCDGGDEVIADRCGCDFLVEVDCELNP